MLTMINIQCELMIKGVVFVVDVQERVVVMYPKNSVDKEANKMLLWSAPSGDRGLSNQGADAVLNTIHTLDFRQYSSAHSIAKMLRTYFINNL